MADQPHEYVPAGPLESAPRGKFTPPEARREAFTAVLDGIPVGAYDHRMIEWLTDLDDPTCQALASLMWRCRLAGPPGSVTEWGVRSVYDGKRVIEEFGDEEEAREVAAQMAELRIPDDGTATLMRHQVGPWEEVPGD